MEKVNDTDDQLLALFKEEPEEAIKKIFFKYYDNLLYLANNIIYDIDISRELVRQEFLYLWKQRDHVNKKDNLKTELQKGIIKASIDYLKSENEGETSNLENIEFEIEPDPELLDDNEMTVYEIEKSFRNLSPIQRAIFVLNRFEKFHPKQIAVVLDISQKKVEAELHDIFQIMKNEMKTQLEP